MSAQEKQTDTGPRLIGAREVERMIGVSRWSVWRYERAGLFPRSIRVGPPGSARLWVESEILEWLARKLAERD